LSAGFTGAWEFVVKPGRAEEFERHYGPDGGWSDAASYRACRVTLADEYGSAGG
jgi:hypothetical protein